MLNKFFSPQNNFTLFYFQRLKLKRKLNQPLRRKVKVAFFSMCDFSFPVLKKKKKLRFIHLRVFTVSKYYHCHFRG